MELLVDTIPYCHSTRMVLIECFDLKLKLKNYLNNLKLPTYLNL
jgi:hypothetical protein